jgi:hypothetical protein
MEVVMEVSIHRADGFWTVHDGVQFAVPKIHRMVADTESLLVLIDSIHAVYPDCKIWIDPKITLNPYLSARLFTCNYYKLTPVYENVQAVLDHPEMKSCPKCEGEAWYDPDKKMWHCNRKKCDAYEYPNSNYWFQISKNARR